MDNAVKAFKLEEQQAKGCVRLREYNAHFGIPQRPFAENALDQTISKYGCGKLKFLVVDTKKEGEDWEQVWSEALMGCYVMRAASCGAV